MEKAIFQPKETRSDRRLWLVIPALLVCLLAVNIYFLWHTHSEQVEGDVLIHLVLARNIADGRFFEYGAGQSSVAGTSPLWEGLLACAGQVSGTLPRDEAFFSLARWIAVFFLVLAVAAFFHATRRRSGNIPNAWIVAALILSNPVTVYWCLANPMETALALFLAALSLLFFGACEQTEPWSWKQPVGWALLVGLTYLTRPELVVLPGLLCLSLLVFVPGGMRRLAGCLAWGLVLFGVAAVIFHQVGGSLFPGAAESRRIYLKAFNAMVVPGLHWRINIDALMFVILYLPMIGLLVKRGNTRERAGIPHIVVLLGLGMLTLFFTFIFCTTWRGRYLLPVHAALLALAVPEWRRLFASRWSTVPAYLLAGYAVLLNGVLLYPLAAHAAAPHGRSAQMASGEYYQPAPDEKRVLVQEVQGAYYHPDLHFISTDGLVDGAIIDAWRAGDTFYDFIMEVRPDLIGRGVVVLSDPDRLAGLVEEALSTRGKASCKDFEMEYAGHLKGSGEILRIHYKR